LLPQARVRLPLGAHAPRRSAGASVATADRSQSEPVTGRCFDTGFRRRAARYRVDGSRGIVSLFPRRWQSRVRRHEVALVASSRGARPGGFRERTRPTAWTKSSGRGPAADVHRDGELPRQPMRAACSTSAVRLDGSTPSGHRLAVSRRTHTRASDREGRRPASRVPGRARTGRGSSSRLLHAQDGTLATPRS